MCGRHGGDHTKHSQNHWDVSDPGVYLAAIFGRSRQCSTPWQIRSKKGTHHSLNLCHTRLETKQIEEQPGWLQHLLATASGTTPSESAQAGNTGDIKTLDVGETNARPTDVTLLRLPACIAVFEKVEQECEVLGADPLTTVSDQFFCSFFGGQWQLRRTGRKVYEFAQKSVTQTKCKAPCMNLA